jgi:uncharacterized membrane protein YfcA
VLMACLTLPCAAALHADEAVPARALAVHPVTGAHATLACTECHGPDPSLSRFDPSSPLHRSRVATTCGACHAKERDAYAISTHAAALAKGNGFAPTCVSCHGGHNIVAVRSATSPVAPGNVPHTCGECHEDPAILRASALPYNAVEGYEATLHGTALTHGVSDVATCASCHGAHDILPASDPRSWVNPQHLGRTCGACHRNVTAAMIAQVSHRAGPPVTKGFFARLRVYLPVAGSSVNPVLISGMGALVGFLSGLFGVGGGFLMTPLLIFIGIPAAVAAATDAAQITAGATSGALSHSRLGNVDFKMGLFIVAGGWTGGVVGVQLVKVLRNLGNFDFFLKLVYVIVLGFIGTTMFLEGVRAWRGRGHVGEPRRSGLTLFFSRLPFQVHFPKSGLDTSALLPFGAGFLVGVLAAFLGVGGGFIMLPAMIYIIGIPTRVAVGTDLFQIVLTSANVTFQQAITNHTVDVLLAVLLFLGSVIGAQFGVMASRRLRGEQIRVFLAAIVMIVMAILLVQLLSPPAHLIDFAKSGGGH